MKKFVLTFVFSLLMLFVPQESFSQKIDEVHVVDNPEQADPSMVIKFKHCHSGGC